MSRPFCIRATSVLNVPFSVVNDTTAPGAGAAAASATPAATTAAASATAGRATERGQLGIERRYRRGDIGRQIAGGQRRHLRAHRRHFTRCRRRRPSSPVGLCINLFCARSADMTVALSPTRGSLCTTNVCVYVWPSTINFSVYVPGSASGPWGAGVTDPGDEFIWLLMSGL